MENDCVSNNVMVDNSQPNIIHTHGDQLQNKAIASEKTNDSLNTKLLNDATKSSKSFTEIVDKGLFCFEFPKIAQYICDSI